MYGHVYVARVAMGAKMPQTVQAMLEAESYAGPSLIIAYSHCIAHGYDMAFGMAQQKLAVDSGVWPLYRFDPRRVEKGEPPMKLDYGPPRARVADYMRNESRFRMVERDRSGAVQAVPQSRPPRTPRNATPSISNWRGSPFPRWKPKTKTSSQEGGEIGEPVDPNMDLSTTYLGMKLPASADGGSIAAERRDGRGAGRSKTPDRRPLSCARSSKSRSCREADGGHALPDATDESFAEASSLLSERRDVRISGRTST